MNKAKLTESLNQHVRLRPLPRRLRPDGVWLPERDYDWIVEAVGPNGVKVRNISTDHSPLLGFDHIHSYISDAMRDWNGIKHGFLDLNVQLTLSGCNVFVEPIRPIRPRQVVRRRRR